MPIDPIFVCATENGICLLEFVDRKMLGTEFKQLQRLLKANIIVGENSHIIQAKKELEEYFNGLRTKFDVALNAPGTKFQKQALRTILYGTTVSYQLQAINIGNPKAARAVASANGSTRKIINFPYHRVIGKDGMLAGYAGGLERKKWLLNMEVKNSNMN